MDYRAMVADLRGALDMKEESAAVVKRAEKSHLGWDDGLSAYSAVLVSEKFGESFLESGKVERSVLDKETAATMLEKAGILFCPPKFVSEAPFDGSEGYWWESVKESLASGDAYKDGAPNSVGITNRWVERIGAEYGWGPVDEKASEMFRQVQQALLNAAKVLRKKKEVSEVSADSMKRAAILLHGVKPDAEDDVQSNAHEDDLEDDME